LDLTFNKYLEKIKRVSWKWWWFST